MAQTPWKRLVPTLVEEGYLGCELTVFGHPQSNQFLRFPGGVTAIFGPNGVGKSRTLTALRDLLDKSGEGGTRRLYVRIDSRYHAASAPFHTDGGVDFRNFRVPEELDLDMESVTYLVASWFCSDRNLKDQGFHDLNFTSEPVGDPALAVEIALSKTFAVTPTRGRWAVAAAVPPDPGPGPLREELERTRRLARTEDPAELEAHIADEYRLLHTMDFSLLDALRDQQRPPWAPLPLETVGEVKGWWVADVLDLDLGAQDLPIGLASDSSQEERDAHVTLVNEIFAALFLDAFPLNLEWGTPDDWFEQRAPRWAASPPMPDMPIGWEDDDQGIDLRALSDAQRRWANFAIRLAGHLREAAAETRSWAATPQDERGTEPRISPIVVTADEPERGMSMLAQRHLSRGMNALHRQFGVEFFVTTHSPAIIEEPSTNLIRAERDEHLHLRLTEVEAADSQVFQNLGIPPWELPQLFRVILFVEGTHDEVILDTLVGGELAQLRVKVLALRGAGRHLRSIAADADFLATHTNAKFLLLIDNVNGDVFREALALMRGGAAGIDVDRFFEQGLARTQTEEERTLRTLVTRLAESGQGHRLHGIVGLPVPDVIELLPPTMVSDEFTWAELREQHAQRRKGQANDFKKWLQQEFGIQITPRLLQHATANLDHVPDAITELLESCRAAAVPGESDDR